jgi:gas vesicle protein
MSKKSSKFALGALIAAGAGYLAGILTAPKSGKETRQDINVATKKAKLTAEKKLRELNTELSELITKANVKKAKLQDTAKKDVDIAVDYANKMKVKVNAFVKTLKSEKESEQSEIDKVVNEAKQAFERLKKSLEKHEKQAKKPKK